MPNIVTYVFAFYLTMLNDHMVEAQASTNFLNPGQPVKGEEDLPVEEIGGFKRFLHKLGVDLDPSDVIVGLVVLSLIGGAAWYFMSTEKDQPAKEAEDI